MFNLVPGFNNAQIAFGGHCGLVWVVRGGGVECWTNLCEARTWMANRYWLSDILFADSEWTWFG